jgi:tripeptide aminopeptidase
VRGLLKDAGWRTEIDAAGNVVAGAPAAGRGNASRNFVLVSAHLDTALTPSGAVRVRRAGTRLEAPGITDNGAGLAALVAVASAFRAANLATRIPVVFAANVGEEGEGNLRGMRALVERYGRCLEAVIVVDGASLGHVITRGVASRRLEATVTGPGGHSWGDAGAPNPIHALGRALARLVALPLPQQPRTALNVGLIEGGTAVNAIPARASFKADLRSESAEELDRLEREVRLAVEQGARAERDAARSSPVPLKIEFRLLGSRPAGELPPRSPLLAAICDVDRHLGLRVELQAASTDANIPLSAGIPAIAIGAGGAGGGAHTPGEWYDAAGRETGLERLLLTLLLAAGPAL